MHGTAEEKEGLAWPGAARAVARNATILKAVILVAFVVCSIVLCTAGVYLRSWELQFKIQELKDYILIANQPDFQCDGTTNQEWALGAIENFRGCEARQREDFTRSDKEIYDQCISTHPFQKEQHCQRGKEVRFFLFNITNPQDVVEGLTPRIVEVGRKIDGGPLVFYEDCKTFDTEFRARDVEFNEHCYYTYKYPATEEDDLGQEVITVNVGLMEAMGNSFGKVDYIVTVVWGTKGLDVLNATTTTVEDFMRGQLLSFSWPNNFGADFLAEFSESSSKAGFRAKDNARRLFEMVLDTQQEFCMVNGRQYDRNQCTSMANTLVIYSKQYYESFQTFRVEPYGLTYKQGAGLLVRAKLGDLLGYYAGFDDPISSYLFPRKVSWNAVRSRTQVEVEASIRAGFADSQNGLLNAGPLGRSTVISNTIEDLGSYTKYKGRTFITEFDWQGCRPLGEGGQVVVPPDGPYPPQCNGGDPIRVRGSRGTQVKPQVWSLQPGVEDTIDFFSKTLMRPVTYNFIEDFELEADNNNVVSVRRYELNENGLKKARLAFNCDTIFKTMSETGVLNRGSDCDELPGMFDISAAYNNIPYVWSLPHFYLVEAADSNQQPRNNLIGFVTPTGSRYQNMVTVERESGKVLESMVKEQISVRMYQDSRNQFFTKHKRVAIPLYWRMDTKNATVSERQLLSVFQSTFRGLNAGFIACVIAGGLSLVIALFVGMLIYRDNSLHTVEEKRKKIQAELAEAVPPDMEEDRGQDDADEHADLM
eukprot:TRINITY_DN4607_c0_g2_i1.p1 TRINITY_DN4607_c0_g2~~TRINITY_DN4607_c0_g2_i1.p1  ORF type:complete len:761 (+),score=154.39 TRINITY_DN4607_c0_g2_i1:151-2433(+)